MPYVAQRQNLIACKNPDECRTGPAMNQHKNNPDDARPDQRTDGSDRFADLLQRLEHGDKEAFDELLPLVYQELRIIARRQKRGRSGGPKTTALVHEAYLKLANRSGYHFADRGHFFAVAAKAMRHLLIDQARQRQSQKRGGEMIRLSFDEVLDHPGDKKESSEILLDLDRALGNLGERDPRLLQVIECRFFAGLSVEETAEALSLSSRTIKRDWLKARVWLQLQLEPPASPVPAP